MSAKIDLEGSKQHPCNFCVCVSVSYNCVALTLFITKFRGFFWGLLYIFFVACFEILYLIFLIENFVYVTCVLLGSLYMYPTVLYVEWRKYKG